MLEHGLDHHAVEGVFGERYLVGITDQLRSLAKPDVALHAFDARIAQQRDHSGAGPSAADH